jgi:hypothetical protein
VPCRTPALCPWGVAPCFIRPPPLRGSWWGNCPGAGIQSPGGAFPSRAWSHGPGEGWSVLPSMGRCPMLYSAPAPPGLGVGELSRRWYPKPRQGRSRVEPGPKGQGHLVKHLVCPLFFAILASTWGVAHKGRFRHGALPHALFAPRPSGAWGGGIVQALVSKAPAGAFPSRAWPRGPGAFGQAFCLSPILCFWSNIWSVPYSLLFLHPQGAFSTWGVAPCFIRPPPLRGLGWGNCPDAGIQSPGGAFPSRVEPGPKGQGHLVKHLVCPLFFAGAGIQSPGGAFPSRAWSHGHWGPGAFGQAFGLFPLFYSLFALTSGCAGRARRAGRRPGCCSR